MPASRRGCASARCSAPCSSPDQYKKYEELQRARPSGQRFGTIWTLEGGRLVPRRVRIGLEDGSQTEIVDGLKEGAVVVLRARELSP